MRSAICVAALALGRSSATISLSRVVIATIVNHRPLVFIDIPAASKHVALVLRVAAAHPDEKKL
jgi:hypothetical protein